MKKLELELNGKAARAVAELIRGEIWIHFEGETFSYKPVARSSGGRVRGSVGTSDSAELLAPMPGKITQIRVKADELVKIGQVLVVMEAMKMEYTLKSLCNGRVSQIHCQVGQQVTVDQPLVSVEAKP